ncbi:MAG: hypothetical protein COV55_00255 [Candidatus Komeilibacteria bacterium CG11_big_fil_rev_8_21_14_0_20_36_20]|uniref:Integral membrane protein (PIN domain superfamily) n=1 Tax=Candidatus Komeilibacteria bacterium CG11_big_fil_rev_8_21_14_0_20_36_20 TaxID=1974477 RepID=A0A2H0NEJ9_9BACT|nr:MAG: hypothetical protein COV55_00255 [Candidatus Komeilibacteria bacterium CG11_big_fil_rev_8_21_14_0_20_36_20]PIR81545.1 MAG: hypothetical protein COU21_03145 [Candidatus Komeilibacteria bacterium CG10_big_fil_rev_8_21_14_0_10_36_65]PJC55453.1 MAG: hypothetical protein CO027_01980 [Candidatus Komeilibacteria bacterium CG_4_9_14_0_2_um_filter_36_13]
MELSILLGKVMGFYFVVMGLALLFKTKVLQKSMEDYINDAVTALSDGVFIFILGLLIVLNHNVWDNSWRVVVTLVGWFALIKGLIRLWMPKSTMNAIVKTMNNKNIYVIGGLVAILVGVFLLFQVY